MNKPPKRRSIDSTAAFLRDPYRFTAQEAREIGSDIFRTRLGLQRAVMLTGPGWARVFYDTRRMTRRGAAPGVVRKTLFGEHGVQTLDGEAHRRRKAMFMSIMTPEQIDRLAGLFREEMRRASQAWERRRRVVLYDELLPVLTRSVCRWAGVRLGEDEAALRTRQLTLLFDQAAAFGLGHLRSRRARRQADRWAASIVTGVRDGATPREDGRPLTVVADHRQADGSPLPAEVAGVELLNLLRPTVAVAVFITWIAHALHTQEEAARRLRDGEDGDRRWFVQEVRRFYPFFPVVAARVREDFEHDGIAFAAGRLVVLDLFGTDRDPRTWSEPDAFDPQRFARWDGCPFGFIPQGGGDHHANHRCAGEWITIRLMEEALGMLTGELEYRVPDQDTSIAWERMPSLPRDRMVIADVRPSTPRRA